MGGERGRGEDEKKEKGKGKEKEKRTKEWVQKGKRRDVARRKNMRIAACAFSKRLFRFFLVGVVSRYPEGYVNPRGARFGTG